MIAEKRNPAGKGGAPNGSAKNQCQFTEWPRTIREIRDDLVTIAKEAWDAGRVVDPHRLSDLADELAWAAAIARMYGGDPVATDRFERAVRETAELASLTRQAVSA